MLEKRMRETLKFHEKGSQKGDKNNEKTYKKSMWKKDRKTMVRPSPGAGGGRPAAGAVRSIKDRSFKDR